MAPAIKKVVFKYREVTSNKTFTFLVKDRYVVFIGEPYFEGSCLQRIRSRNNSTCQFKLLANPNYIEPEEAYQPFVEIEQNLNHHKRTIFNHRVAIIKTLLLFIMI